LPPYIRQTYLKYKTKRKNGLFKNIDKLNFIRLRGPAIWKTLKVKRGREEASWGEFDQGIQTSQIGNEFKRSSNI
jgi:plasmid replication initiation protein